MKTQLPHIHSSEVTIISEQSTLHQFGAYIFIGDYKTFKLQSSTSDIDFHYFQFSKQMNYQNIWSLTWLSIKNYAMSTVCMGWRIRLQYNMPSSQLQHHQTVSNYKGEYEGKGHNNIEIYSTIDGKSQYLASVQCNTQRLSEDYSIRGYIKIHSYEADIQPPLRFISVQAAMPFNVIEMHWAYQFVPIGRFFQLDMSPDLCI